MIAGAAPASAATVSATVTVTTPQDTPVQVAGADRLCKGSASGAIAGSLSLAADAALVYTPANGYSGVDSFTVPCNGTAETPTDFAVTVTTANAAPTVSDISATTASGTSVGVALKGTDADGDALTYAVSGAKGDTSVSSGTLTYTPKSDFVGTDSFTYTASDGKTTSAPAKVTITVTAPVKKNTPPTAADVTGSTTTGTPVDITLAGKDADGDALTYTATGATGTTSIKNGVLTYTPKDGYTGTDTFTYTATDGTDTSPASKVTVTVTAPASTSKNTAPTAGDVSGSTTGDTPVDVALAGNDADNDPLTYKVVSGPDRQFQGTVEVVGQHFRFSPVRDDGGGEFVFTYSVDDGIAPPVRAKVEIYVFDNEHLRAETTSGKAVSFAMDDRYYGVFDAYDCSENVSFGYIENAKYLTYTPPAGFVGVANCEVDLSYGSGISDTFYLRVVVTAPENSAPTVKDVSGSTTSDKSVTLTLAGTDPEKDPLSFTTAGATGTTSIKGDQLTYTPRSGYTGTDSFTYTASDGKKDSAPAKVTITVTAPLTANAAPTAADVDVSTPAFQPVTVALPGKDADGDALTYALTGRPRGTASIKDGVLTYTPANYGSGYYDTFGYTVTDGNSSPVTAKILIRISDPPNSPPVADGASGTTTSGTPIVIFLRATDFNEDSELLKISVTGATGGTTSLTGRLLTYTPRSDFVGTDEFSYTAIDSQGAESKPGRITVTVTRPNGTPTVADVTGATTSGTAVSIDLKGTDPDKDALSYSVTGATGGTTSVKDGVLTYTPRSDFVGTDAFTYTASDPSKAESAPARITVTVTKPNTVPTAADVNGTTTSDKAIAIALKGADADGDQLTYTASGSATGTVIVGGPQVVYTPKAGFVGTDTFTYTASDGKGTSKPATVTVTVTKPNSVPTLGNLTASTTTGKAVTVVLDGKDADGDALTYEATATKTPGGTVVITKTATGASLTYTPNPGFSGTDTAYVLTANDGKAASAPAKLTVTVVVPNTQPTASDVTGGATSGVAVKIPLAGKDLDVGDALTYGIGTAPVNGTATISGSSVAYTSKAGFTGTESFTYTVTDGKSAPVTAKVTVAVGRANTPPVVAATSATTATDTAVKIAVTGTDADGDTLTYKVVAQPAGGSAAVVSGSAAITYTPKAGFSGSDTFTYTANDGTVDAAAATVTITVKKANTAPTAADVTTSASVGIASPVALAGKDADGDPLVYTVGKAAKGTVTVGGATATYTPKGGSTGTDTFTYTVSDGKASATAKVTVTIVKLNTAPTAGNVSASTGRNTCVQIVLAGKDADGDALTYTVGPVRNGTVAIRGDRLTYLPNREFTGTETFAYTVSDGVAKATGTVTVKISNSQPVVKDQLVSTSGGRSVVITLAGRDPDGDALAYSAGPVRHGVLVKVSATQYRYTPYWGWSGTDSFTFAANDGIATSDSATVTIRVGSCW